jgi:hypothetical protein
VLDHGAPRVRGDMTIVVDTAPIEGQRDGVPLVAELGRHVSQNDTVLPGSEIFGPVPTWLPYGGDPDAVRIAGDTRG